MTLVTGGAAQAPTEEAPGAELPQSVFHNDRAKRELGWQPRSLEETVVDTVNSMIELGLLNSTD